MSIYIAQTPKEFREKIIEFQATSIVFKKGDYQGTLPIVQRTDEKVEKIFNDCISRAVGDSPELTRITVTMDAYKNEIAVISSKWLVVRMVVS